MFMNGTSTLRRCSGKEKEGPYLRGIGNTESENETPSEDIGKPVMRLRSRKRVSGQSFRAEAESVPVCMLKT
jgi:hypothetical protein